MPRQLAQALAQAAYEKKPGTLVVVRGDADTRILLDLIAPLAREAGLVVWHAGQLGLDTSGRGWQFVMERPHHRSESAQTPVGRNTPEERQALAEHLEAQAKAVRPGDRIALQVDADVTAEGEAPAFELADVEAAARAHGFEVHEATYSTEGSGPVLQVVLRRLPTTASTVETPDPMAAAQRLPDWAGQVSQALASGDHEAAAQALGELFDDADLVATHFGRAGGIVEGLARELAATAETAQDLLTPRAHEPTATSPDSSQWPDLDIDELLAQLFALSATLRVVGTIAAGGAAGAARGRVAPDPNGASAEPPTTTFTPAHERDPNWTTAVPPPATQSEDVAFSPTESRKRRVQGIIAFITGLILAIGPGNAPARTT